jgi:hypothetical protein
MMKFMIFKLLKNVIFSFIYETIIIDLILIFSRVEWKVIDEYPTDLFSRGKEKRGMSIRDFTNFHGRPHDNFEAPNSLGFFLPRCSLKRITRFHVAV